MPEGNESLKEIIDLLHGIQERNDNILVLSADEVKIFRDLVKTISIEDLKYIKEYSEDRKAISRVFGKVKNFMLVTAAVIAAYFTIVKLLGPVLREAAIRFLQGGTPGT
jgi:hypothetical protein